MKTNVKGPQNSGVARPGEFMLTCPLAEDGGSDQISSTQDKCHCSHK